MQYINVPGGPEKVTTFENSYGGKFTKSTSQIRMIQISLTAERSKNFCDFSPCLTSTRNIGKLNFTNISWLQND